MRIALCAIGRRENLYAREFVEHYLALGFDRIIICDNNHEKEECFEDVIGDYVSSRKVIIHGCRGLQGAQCQVYNDVYRQYGRDYDWIAFFDFDEFLCLEGGLSVKEWLSRFDGTGTEAVLVNWMCFGDGGMVFNDGRPLMERFTEPLPYDKTVQYDFPNNNHVKSILRGGMGSVTFRANPHVPDDVTRCCRADGTACSPRPFQPYDFSVAYLRHFATKTISEWMNNKWQKGTANKPTMEAFRDKYRDRFFRYNEVTEQKRRYVRAYEKNRSERVTVCIVNYNTTALTRAAILSLQRHSPGVAVIVFDNSDREPFTPMDGVEILDNTRGQIINFDKFLSRFPDKVDVGNGWASAKHCYTVQWLIAKRSNPFILMDSDVLVRRSITRFWDREKAFVGQVKPHRSAFKITVNRVLPFCCFINVPMLKKYRVSYFNYSKMWALTTKRPDQAYDTGCWFLEDVLDHGLPYENISIDPYILHFGHGSWRDKEPSAWLEEYKHLWQC